MAFPYFTIFILFVFLASTLPSTVPIKKQKYYLVERGGSQDLTALEEIFKKRPNWKSAIEWLDPSDPNYMFLHSKVKRAYTHFRWVSVSDVFLNRREYSSHEIVNRIPFRHGYGLCSKGSAFESMENIILSSINFPQVHNSSSSTCHHQLFRPDLEFLMAHTPLSFHPTRSPEDLEFFELFLKNIIQSYSDNSLNGNERNLPVFSFTNSSKLHIYSTWTSQIPLTKLILKPSEGTRGVGISIFDVNTQDDVDDLIDLLKDEDQNEDFIVQPYIPKPLLIHGHKFDIRQFVLLTEIFDPLNSKSEDVENPKNKGYIFNDFYLRFASVPYSIDDDNKFIHLTNHQIQKHNKAFHDSTHQDDSDIQSIPTSLQWSSESFFQWLTENYGESAKNTLIEKIHRLVGSVLQTWPMCHSVHNSKRFHTRPHSFELLGFDILIDESLEPWLLEVNCSPGLHMLTPVVRKHHTNALEGMASIVVDNDISSGTYTEL